MGYLLVCHPPERLSTKYPYSQTPRHNFEAFFDCLKWNSKNYENNLMDCSKTEKSVLQPVHTERRSSSRKRKTVDFVCVSIIALSILRRLRIDMLYLESTT